MRIATGTQDGLRSRWRHGIAVVEQGSLQFLPRIGGTVFARPGQTWQQITVITALRAREREVKGREIWSVNQSASFIVLRTPTAVLECALPGERWEWVLARLNGSEAER